MENLENINILSFKEIPAPLEIKKELPITDDVANFVISSRETVKNILLRKDPRILIIVGPCSIHDEKAAIDYAKRLKAVASEISNNIFIIMRVYFEKPRTTIGWKGFINDPFLNGSFCMEEGLRRARRLMIEINKLGLPVASEALDPFVPQYLDDLITWTAIGARTVESQTHREMASGLSTPVGFKNSTDGSFQPALNALKAVSGGHHFLGINEEGKICVCHTRGNTFAHIVLRGGSRPNYDSVSIDMCEAELEASGLAKNIMIDCSHDNSFKKAELQIPVLRHCLTQILEGNQSIFGFMLESNLHTGSQKLETNQTLQYGVSITDECIGWDETEKILLEANEKLSENSPRT